MGSVDRLIQASRVQGRRCHQQTRGDGLPEELRQRESRLERIPEAKAAPETEARKTRAQTLREQDERNERTARTHPEESAAQAALRHRVRQLLRQWRGMRSENKMANQRYSTARILREHAEQLAEKREETDLMLMELAEASPALARLAILALPAYHDDDATCRCYTERTR